MKPSELRIGNYVSTPNQESFKIDGFEYLNREDCKVEMYYEASYPIGWWMGKKIKVPAQRHPLTWNLKDLSPIPLTEEWLLKFGFEKYAQSSVSTGWEIGVNPITRDYLMTLVWINDDNGLGKYPFYLNGHFEIKSVHQLQNLYFALTGEELELKEIK